MLFRSEAVERAAVLPHTLRPVVAAGTPIADAVDQIATSLYGAEGVDWSPTARDQLAVLADLGFDHLPICVAKTHLSLSHDPTLAGAPRGWTLPVRELRLRAGAGFVTVYAGDIVTMPGLPARPRYRDIDLAPDGTIIGLA